MTETAIFGIRHHGPGSARRLLAALDAFAPDRLLVELPADATPHLGVLASEGFVPPVALLAYGGGGASFFPFAEWSPEYVALRWALARGVPVAGCDRPVWATPPDREHIPGDALDRLARAGGREDFESWWNDMFEAVAEDDPDRTFAAIESAVAAAREGEVADDDTLEREAWMRRAIQEAERSGGRVAVVCGAWHAPALRAPFAPDGAAALDAAPRRSVSFAWAPWSHAHLARASGYGAGVVAPLWYRHIWRAGTGEAARAAWMSGVTRALRGRGFDASPAQAIDAARLADSLAAVRGRPVPGFEEVRDAIVASVLHGNALAWHEAAPGVLVGDAVGAVPPQAAGSPLLADCDAQALALKLEKATERQTFECDLREPRGRARSAFLHRLRALGVMWGKPSRVSGALGTFREAWTLAWSPSFAATLAESTPLGATVAAAAETALARRLGPDADIAEVMDVANDAVRCDAPGVLDAAARCADAAMAGTTNAFVMARAGCSAASSARFGTARGVGMEGWAALARRLFAGAAFALPSQARGLDAAQAREAADAVDPALDVLAGLEDAGSAREAFAAALDMVAADAGAAPFFAAFALRRRMDAGGVTPAEAALVLARSLSPSVPFAEAGETFEGFFRKPVPLLIHNPALRSALNAWLSGLDEEGLDEAIPAFRRAFSGASRAERLAVWEAVFGDAPDGDVAGTLEDAEVPGWEAHRAVVLETMGVRW